MTTEDYVSFETAKLLKEKGFDVRCQKAYWPDGSICNQAFSNAKEIAAYSRPTLQMAMKWLREKKCCPIEILWHFDSDNQIDVWYFKHHVELRELPVIKYYDTYEGACEAAIKYCLENLI